MAHTMDLFTPRSVIAGRLTGSQGRAQASALQGAAAVLGTEQVAIIYASEKDVVWYLAAPASDLASHLPSASALAAALPHSAGHQGDGAYVVELEAGLQAVVVKQADKFQSFVGTPAMVQRFVVMEGAGSTHLCAGAGMPWTLPAEPTGGRLGRVLAWLTWAGLLVAMVSIGVWLWAAAQGSAYQQESDDMHLVQRVATKSVLQSLAPPSYPKALTNLQRAVEQGARQGGNLIQFEHKDGHSSWSLNVNNQVVTGSAN